MALDRAADVSPIAVPDGPGDKTAADRQEIRRLAEQFEAMLMTQMLREMRRSMLDSGDQEDGLGEEALTDTGDIEFGSAMSRSGGLGLTRDLLKVFERQITALQGGTSTPADAPADPPAGSAVMQEQKNAFVPDTTRSTSGGAIAMMLPPLGDAASAPVSSAFGWRRDPMTGAAAFHKGIDLAVAYGHDVSAAAPGVVAFAGVQNGYGTTVIIDHEGGRQTRYAHLSESLVRQGEMVAEGQVVGKSGSSGRSTGPHLHFEMLVNGRAVDPRRWARNLSGTKEMPPAVDD
jgi:murein DD-endopeptidase MepM/ murein hydrolase activator NlpD